MTPALPGPLHETLMMAADVLRPARDPWWIIASAAMAIHGAHPITVADVDLLMSERDARHLVATLGLAPIAPDGKGRFRSTIFARWEGPPVPVEIMAGFHVHTDEGWHPILPATRLPIPIGHATLFVPSIAELIEHCALFGRPKDAARAAILRGQPDSPHIRAIPRRPRGGRP